MTLSSRLKTETGLPQIANSFTARTLPASDWLSVISDPSQRLVALLQVATDVLAELRTKHENGDVFLELCDETILIQLPNRKAVLHGFDGESKKNSTAMALDSHLTLERAIFLAPELTGVLQRPLGPPTDLYSLGVFLYRSIAGVAPIRATNLNELMLGQMTNTVRDLRSHGIKVTRCVDEFVQRLL